MFALIYRASQESAVRGAARGGAESGVCIHTYWRVSVCVTQSVVYLCLPLLFVPMVIGIFLVLHTFWRAGSISAMCNTTSTRKHTLQVRARLNSMRDFRECKCKSSTIIKVGPQTSFSTPTHRIEVCYAAHRV